MHSGNPDDLAFVLDYMNVPYVKHGRTHDGADCWGVTRLMLHEQKGWDLPVMRLGADMPVDEQIQAVREEELRAWRVLTCNETPQLFDVIVYRSLGALHIGVMLTHIDYFSATETEMFCDSITRMAFNRIDLRFYRRRTR